MRTIALVLAVVFAITLSAALPTSAGADESISRDSRGPQPVRDHDPLGGPPTPRLYLLGQNTIFIVGIALLVVAALLGVYTLMAGRPSEP
jgi:hypothetical protein